MLAIVDRSSAVGWAELAEAGKLNSALAEKGIAKLLAARAALTQHRAALNLDSLPSHPPLTSAHLRSPSNSPFDSPSRRSRFWHPALPPYASSSPNGAPNWQHKFSRSRPTKGTISSGPPPPDTKVPIDGGADGASPLLYCRCVRLVHLNLSRQAAAKCAEISWTTVQSRVLACTSRSQHSKTHRIRIRRKNKGVNDFR